MKTFCYISLVLSVLFLSVDGAADLVIQGHPHGGDAVHQVSDVGVTEESAISDSDLNGDHCERCCHGHTASLTAPIVSINLMPMGNCCNIGNAPHLRSFPQAPPTPPPNA